MHHPRYRTSRIIILLITPGRFDPEGYEYIHIYIYIIVVDIVSF